MKKWLSWILPIASGILLLAAHRITTIPYAPGITALAIIVLFLIFNRRIFLHQGDRRPGVRISLMAFAAAFSYAAALGMALEGIDKVPTTWKVALEDPFLTILNGIHPVEAIIVYAALPAAEELIFRCGLQRNGTNSFTRILLSMVPFTAYCYLRSGGEAALISLFLGALLTFIEETWHSAFLDILAHISFHGGLLLAFATLFLEGNTLLIAAAVSLLISAFLVYALYQSAFEEDEGEESED